MKMLRLLFFSMLFAVLLFGGVILFSGISFCWLPGAHFPDPLVPTPTVGCFYSS